MSQAYLLAAGNGRRAGGPKAWLDYEGKTLMEKQMEFLLKRFRPENIAVSIQKEWLDRCRAIHGAAKWIPVNPEAQPLGAIQSLMKAAPLKDWGFLHHVDMPVWEPGLFDMLAGRCAQAGGACEAIVASHEGRKGHPVVLAPGLQKSILALDPARDRLDRWLRARRVEVVEVPFACVLENWNQLAGTR